MYKYCILKTHNPNLLLSLLLSPSSLKISNNSNSVSLSPTHLDQYPAQLLSRQVMGPEVFLLLWITVMQCLLPDIVVRNASGLRLLVLVDACITDRLHPISASVLQSLLALFGGASAKLASSYDVSSAQDDTICQGLYWLHRALLRLN